MQHLNATALAELCARPGIRVPTLPTRGRSKVHRGSLGVSQLSQRVGTFHKGSADASRAKVSRDDKPSGLRGRGMPATRAISGIPTSREGSVNYREPVDLRQSSDLRLMERVAELRARVADAVRELEIAWPPVMGEDRKRLESRVKAWSKEVTDIMDVLVARERERQKLRAPRQ